MLASPDVRRRDLPALVLAGLLGLGPVVTDATGSPPPGEPPNAPVVRPGARPPAPADTFSLPDLPDEGPRIVQPVEGPAAALFEQTVASCRRGDGRWARTTFKQLVERHPDSPLIAPARAFLAELLVTEKPGSRGLMEAIDAYRALAQDFPGSPNALRARWRIGDLYAAMGLRVEARGTYERAVVELPDGADADRALLGLAMNFAEWDRMSEAEHALRMLRQRTHETSLLQYATVGLADVLFTEQRTGEAESLYRTATEQWPEFLKRRPASLLRYADLTMELGQDALARRLYLVAYNLRPGSAAAPEALVRVGDSFRRHGAVDRAGLFYGLAAERHPGTLGEALARMRLAELGHELLAARPARALHELVRSLVHAGPVPGLDPARQRLVLRDIAAAYADLALGSEALFHLALLLESERRLPEAIKTYGELIERADRLPDDPWPERGSRRLAALLAPEIRQALDRGDELAAVALYFRLGVFAERVFAGGELVLRIADAGRRLGFLPKAITLYQTLLRDRAAQRWREEALIGLGEAYLNQHDFTAARQVFDRYRIQHPLGRRLPDALRLLAEAAFGADDPRAAVRACRLWLERYPEHPARPGVLLTLAAALVEGGDRKAGLRAYAEAERAGALIEPAVLLRYADLLAEAGRFEEATARYGLVLMTAPVGAAADWARLQVARIRRAENDVDTAEVALDALSAEAVDPMAARLAVALAVDLPIRTGEKRRNP